MWGAYHGQSESPDLDETPSHVTIGTVVVTYPILASGYTGVVTSHSCKVCSAMECKIFSRGSLCRDHTLIKT